MIQKALICGISAYGRHEWRDLWGVSKDMEIWKSVVPKLLPNEDREIKVLLEKNCTRQAILTHIDWLVDGAGEEDWLLFVYGGHGAQFVSKNPDGTVRKLQECLVPYDFSWDNPLSDEDLAERFNKLINTGGNLVAIFDCCHAGGLDRDIIDSRYPVIVEYPREIPIPKEMAALIEQMRSSGGKRSTFLSCFAGAGADATTMVFACAADEKAWDTWVNGDFRGIFSFAACEAILAGAASSGELITRASTIISERGFRGGRAQTPSATRDKPIRAS